MIYLESAQFYFLNEFYKSSTTQIRQGVVHLDMLFDNLNITTYNEVIISTLIEGNRIIKGYESVQPISLEEKRLIPIIGVTVYFFYLVVQCQLYDNFSNSFLNENFLKRYLNGLVKKYYDIYKLGYN